MVCHSNCLGLRLTAMDSRREDVYEQLKSNLYQNDAVTGEAVGIAMGIVMLGFKSTHVIDDMPGTVSLIHIFLFLAFFYYSRNFLYLDMKNF